MKSKIINVLVALIMMACINDNLRAQNHELIADYPLIENLSEATGRHIDVILEGNPTAPTVPMTGTELCANGIYILNTNGQNIISPILAELDINKFQYEVDFKITQLPNLPPNNFPIIMASKFARWLGIYIDQNGTMGFKFNNDDPNIRWSSTTISGIDIWNTARISYNYGHVELFLNGNLILIDEIGALVTFQNTFNFSTTDFSNGRSLNGCIRNLMIANNVDTVFRGSFE